MRTSNPTRLDLFICKSRFHPVHIYYPIDKLRSYLVTDIAASAGGVKRGRAAINETL
jgi:hypothetical protein